MADIVYINSTSQAGSRVLSALRQISSGLATLHELDGFRAESIGAGQATMAQNFGVANTNEDANGDAQALSDRWGALLAAYANGGNAEYAKLRDLINATATAP